MIYRQVIFVLTNIKSRDQYCNIWLLSFNFFIEMNFSNFLNQKEFPDKNLTRWTTVQWGLSGNKGHFKARENRNFYCWFFIKKLLNSKIPYPFYVYLRQFCIFARFLSFFDKNYFSWILGIFYQFSGKKLTIIINE